MWENLNNIEIFAWSWSNFEGCYFSFIFVFVYTIKIIHNEYTTVIHIFNEKKLTFLQGDLFIFYIFLSLMFGKFLNLISAMKAAQ